VLSCYGGVEGFQFGDTLGDCSSDCCFILLVQEDPTIGMIASAIDPRRIFPNLYQV